jgi:hypothetical protein
MTSIVKPAAAMILSTFLAGRVAGDPLVHKFSASRRREKIGKIGKRIGIFFRVGLLGAFSFWLFIN